ncbi:MAG TPA: DUF2252 domain-containing protein [Phenylobacterium sp.]|uniref:DUF2252 domain-containing protein n=1 Tax=Phenylobacterium sp. TaxID=1871053 RepID=UPI002B4912E2|nr:DUF2252 domain-containing protein [Phenylobacterium sp.]HKR87164.1 DUF2252 domain-containing protein [Phenylobacterium sp.]
MSHTMDEAAAFAVDPRIIRGETPAPVPSSTTADRARRAPPKERSVAGRTLRERVPLAEHARWKRSRRKTDPIQLLRAADEGRVPELVPIRYGRMLASPFAFYRGSAGLMAADLAATPVSGLKVQACGDCHLMNFGGFATPERNVLFDLNDFDETLPAPWEWDIKRLVVSFVLAARSLGLSDGKGRDAAVACAYSYHKRMRLYAKRHPLEVWYSRITVEDVLALAPRAVGARLQRRLDKTLKRQGSDLDFPRLTSMVSGKIGIRDVPPLIFHPADALAPGFRPLVERVLASYRETLPEDRRSLLDNYALVDAAMKVVGVGSVGRRCWIVLVMSESNQPLFLQFKEAVASVLEPAAGPSLYPHHGQRVVMGQRLMQPASDLLLGWVTGEGGIQFYARQLRDAKIKPLVETFDYETLYYYARMCGWVLARAHAKTGDRASIAGYLGRSDAFDEAMGDFAMAYADQAERDYDALKTAVRNGQIIAHTDI